MKPRLLLPPDPHHPGHHLDPETGIWPISEWGPACARGIIEPASIQKSQRPVPASSGQLRPVDSYQQSLELS